MPASPHSHPKTSMTTAILQFPLFSNPPTYFLRTCQVIALSPAHIYKGGSLNTTTSVLRVTSGQEHTHLLCP